jgi:molybdopterin-guanine dinucleotide biosynthesis protein A
VLTADASVLRRSHVTAVILCGGDARRMGGVQKALQLVSGIPLVAHVHARVSPQVARVIISANRAAATYAQWADTVLVDDVPNCGPLGGIATALRCAITPLLFSCPGDAPFLHETLVDRLATALAMSDTDIAVPHDGERAQHLFALMRVSEHSSLAGYLAAGGRSVHGWLAGRSTVTVDASDIADHFVNINTEEQLVAAGNVVREANSSVISEILHRHSFPHSTVEHP